MAYVSGDLENYEGLTLEVEGKKYLIRANSGGTANHLQFFLAL